MTYPPGYQLKLDQAAEHLQSLKAKIERWLGGHPYVLVNKFNPERGEHSVWIRPEGEPPAEFSIIVGECLYNLRSALDYLVYDLVKAHKGTPLSSDVATKSEFPIFIDRNKFEEHRKRKIGGIDERAQAVIEGLQPYDKDRGFHSFASLFARRHPEAYHPLWLLHELSNIDKHRERHLTLFGPEAVTFGGHNADFAEIVDRDAVSIKSGTTVETLRYLPTDPRREVEVHFSFVLNVAFEEGPPAFGEPVLDVLARLHDFITHDILPGLTPFLI